MSNETNKITNKLVALYEDNIGDLFENSSDLINRERKIAIDYFKKTGIPTTKNESYKYTDLAPVFANGYTKFFERQKFNVELNEAFQCQVPNLNTHTVLFSNGWFYEKNLEYNSLPEGVILKSFQKASKEHPELVEKYYSKLAKSNDDSIVALNTAFCQDGFFLYVPKNTIIDKPIQVINLLRSEKDLMVTQRNLVVLDENSSAKLIICDHALSPCRFLTNTVTEVCVGENAIFDYYNIENQHNLTTQLSSVFINQKKNSNVLTNTLSLHGKLIRNNVSILLEDEGCESNLFGLFLADKDQHIDNYTFIDHAKPNCKSNELYKGILDDEATGGFNGKIVVRQDAQKTQALQSNKNILLTDNAEMNTKPQLEIYADDVKCSHGATIGQIDEEALFYLRTRGINEKEARMMLMFAFAHEILKKIRVDSLDVQLIDLVESRLRGEFSKCDFCNYNVIK
ncbi:MAG: Fe-S cluster assembly protein SufD [Bacteroidetes bacterium]|nr:MAG: Fe-S cluster assembly protein SufD [Bacteroidota bacterium]